MTKGRKNRPGGGEVRVCQEYGYFPFLTNGGICSASNGVLGLTMESS